MDASIFSIPTPIATILVSLNNIRGGDFMAVAPRGSNKPIKDIEAGLLPSAQMALDELLWLAKATLAAKAAEQ
jgi:hypothetical protein